jgi:drug/metabolite transporter (DMT)-like permease
VWLIVLAFTFFSVISIVLFKVAAVEFGTITAERIASLDFLLKIFLNKWVILALVLALLCRVFYLWAISKEALAIVNAATSLSFLFIAVIAQVFFKENLGPLGWLGIILISAGIFLINREVVV